MIMQQSDDRVGALLRELERVLEEERGILLSGHPERLAPAVERKLQLAQQLEIACAKAGVPRPARQAVRRLDQLNRGNAVICSAVLRQLTHTLDRLRRGDCHRSYRADGGETNPPAAGRLGAA
jgi:flagellar biosynthesis/type III secretory pathway chaperone